MSLYSAFDIAMSFCEARFGMVDWAARGSWAGEADGAAGRGSGAVAQLSADVVAVAVRLWRGAEIGRYPQPRAPKQTGLGNQKIYYNKIYL